MEIKIGNKQIKLNSAQVEVFKKLSSLKLYLEQSSEVRSFRKKISSDLESNSVVASFWQITKTNLAKKLSKKIVIGQSHNLKQPQSFYIYGRVGSGKSTLMKDFFNRLQLKNKTYCHFNDFMQQIHRKLHSLRNKILNHCDLVEVATKEIIGDNKILCFDEFQVEDVADAMILNKVFSYLIESGVILVITSNFHPLELYKNGLQRDLFLKFVKEVLEKNCQIINLDNDFDYRGQFSGLIKRYYYPNNSDNKKQVLEIFHEITNYQKPATIIIKLFGRELKLHNVCDDVALFSFEDLFKADFSVVDYQAICHNFKLIFLLDIPRLSKEDRNEAKRLIWFVDEAYENKVKLVILSEVKPEEIYLEGVGSESFKRTASRLNEITIC